MLREDDPDWLRLLCIVVVGGGEWHQHLNFQRDVVVVAVVVDLK